MKYLLILVMLFGFNAQALETHIWSYKPNIETNQGFRIPEIVTSQHRGKLYFSKDVIGFTNGACQTIGEYPEWGISEYTAECTYFRPDGSVEIKEDLITIERAPGNTLILNWDGNTYEKSYQNRFRRAYQNVNILKQVIWDIDTNPTFVSGQYELFPTLNNSGDILYESFNYYRRRAPIGSLYDITIAGCEYLLDYLDENEFNFKAVKKDWEDWSECYLNHPHEFFGTVYSTMSGIAPTGIFMNFEYAGAVHALMLDGAALQQSDSITNDCKKNGNNPNNPHCK